MPKIIDHGRKRADILRAALVTFSRHGYRGTNLQRVAAAAGMGKSSLYHYFPTREALFTALVRQLLQHEATTFDEVIAGAAAPAERLRRLLDAVTDLFAAWVQAGPLLLDFVREPAGRRALRRTFAQVRAATATLIREGQQRKQFRAGDPYVLATVMTGCLDGLLLQELIEPGSTADPAVTRTLGEVLHAALAGDHAMRRRHT